MKKAELLNTHQFKMNSPIGTLYLVATSKGLQGVYWKKQPSPITKSLVGTQPSVRNLAQAANELEEYFDGRRKKFTLPLDLAGTPFQKSVWAQLQKIPYGGTCSYKDIASKIKNSKAVRAVGSANGKNPLCIIIPCHRVIASDGSPGGYSGGTSLKTRLLTLEKKES